MKKLLLISVVFYLKISSIQAQFTVLVNFNINGAAPYSYLTLLGNKMYGMTQYGGVYGDGFIFSINKNGSGFIDLLDFNGINGSNPEGSLTLYGNKFFGMTPTGGLYNNGCIFSIDTNGVNYHDLYNFNVGNNIGDSGYYPLGSLVLSGNVLCGMTSEGGGDYSGTLFSIDTNGSNYTVLLTFDQINGGGPKGSLISVGNKLYGMTCQHARVFSINNDGSNYKTLMVFNDTNGAYSYGDLTLSWNKLFGMALGGELYGRGLVFTIDTNGNDYKDLYDFLGSGNSGSYPYGSLTIAGNVLYGMTGTGAAHGDGNIFCLDTNGNNYKDLYDFNSMDGAIGILTISGNIMYGMTLEGGPGNYGNIFSIGINGTNYTDLKNFYTVNGDGPWGTPTLSGNMLYGMTWSNGSNGDGTIFSVDTNGNFYKNILEFNDTNGATPFGNLIISRNKLFGMTSLGGQYDTGCIFAIDTNGSNYKDIYDFKAIGGGGVSPEGSLTLSGNKLFGMTTEGGIHRFGTIFSIDTNGANYKDLYDFDFANGAHPWGSLLPSGGVLYGMTTFGGTDSLGCVFSVDTNGSSFTILLDFDGTNGGNPGGSLIISGNVLYGTTSNGGANNAGTIFSINTNGSGYRDLFDFSYYNSSGTNPYGTLLIIGNRLYGMANSCCEFVRGAGTLFSIKTDGTGFTYIPFDEYTNGKWPQGSLIFSGNELYSMNRAGGKYNGGVLFKIDTNTINSSPLSVNELYENSDGVLVYPNPCSNALNVSLANKSNLSEIQITDIAGRTLLTENCQRTTDNYSLNVSSLSPGMYFISINLPNGTEVKKFIKE